MRCNKRDALYDFLWQKLVRARVGAKATFGDDFSQNELFGGARRSDRKPGSRNVHVAEKRHTLPVHVVAIGAQAPEAISREAGAADEKDRPYKRRLLTQRDAPQSATKSRRRCPNDINRVATTCKE